MTDFLYYNTNPHLAVYNTMADQGLLFLPATLRMELKRATFGLLYSGNVIWRNNQVEFVK